MRLRCCFSARSRTWWISQMSTKFCRGCVPTQAYFCWLSFVTILVMPRQADVLCRDATTSSASTSDTLLFLFCKGVVLHSASLQRTNNIWIGDDPCMSPLSGSSICSLGTCSSSLATEIMRTVLTFLLHRKYLTSNALVDEQCPVG